MSEKPFSNAAAFFKEAAAPSFRPARLLPDEANPSDRRICRWCLQPIFDEPQKTMQERGELRANLKMPDNGSEIACCANCWDAAAGGRCFVHGKEVPAADPFEIPNPLLRALVEKE